VASTIILGCDGLSDFSTRPGECYSGDIIDAAFVRSGSFEAGVGLTLELDVSALGEAETPGARLTTTDGLFVRSPVKQMAALSLDQLSLLSFPSGRIRSYLAYAPDIHGDIANVVISLMENGDAEVRIFRPAENPEDALFGVFRVTRKAGCGRNATAE
jgi:hypothetical protein